MSDTPDARRDLPATATRIGWVLFIVGVIVYVAGYRIRPMEAAFNNLVGMLFLTSIAVGSVFLIALEYVTGAVWSVPMRRVNEFLAGLTPFAALLAVPLLFNLQDLFQWSRGADAAHDPLMAAKQPYLNVSFFTFRFVAVFGLWTLFFWLFTRNSLKQDLTQDPRRTTFNIRLAAVFMPLLAVTLTVAAVDWMMSLEAHWYSTIFGVYYFSGTVLAALGAGTYTIIRLWEKGFFPGLHRDHFYSLGALLFAFINFWAYIAFSQFLLIWYANLPEETFWFIKRWQNGWEYVSVLLIVVHFAVPYFALLSQDSKMDPKRLKLMALWIIAAHLLDLYWLVMPSMTTGVSLGWMELTFPLLIVGLIILVLSFKMKRHNLIPVGDPKLVRGLGFRM